MSPETVSNYYHARSSYHYLPFVARLHTILHFLAAVAAVAAVAGLEERCLEERNTHTTTKNIYAHNRCIYKTKEKMQGGTVLTTTKGAEGGFRRESS